MKKFLTILLLLATMFPFAAKADQLTVCDGTNTNGYVPVYGFYADDYLRAQMVYPADMLADMAGASVSGMKFYATQSSVSWTGTFQVYVAEVASATVSSFINPTTATTVYTGTLAIAGGEMVFTFDAPFNYAGGNLLIGFDQTMSGNYASSTWKGQNTEGASVQGYSSSSVAGISPTQRNFLPKVTFEYIVSTGLTVEPTDLGARPNGAWMEPATVEVKGGVYGVTAMDLDNDYFTFDGPHTPFTTPASFTVTTGDAAATGQVTGNLSFFYNGSKDMATFAITANAYDPVAGDVVEKATVVSNPTNYTNTPAYGSMYHNYNLPGEASEGVDAVYKVTFANDVMLDANVGGAANGKVALYAEGFNGEGGPMATNNYVYNGPQIEPGFGDNAFFDFEDGFQGWTSLDADGDGYGWKQASTMLSSGLGHNGSADFVLSQSYDNSHGVLYPNNYLVSPQQYVIGGSSVFTIWACGQDAIYAAEHFSIEVSEAGASASDFVKVAEWTIGQRTAKGNDKVRGGSRDQSTWKQYTADLSAYAGKSVWIAIRHFNCPDNFYLDVDDVELSTGSKGVARGGRSTLTYNFDDGTLQGWTAIDNDGDGYNWYATTGYGANSGSYAAASESYNDFSGALYPDNYLVSPQITLGEGASISFYEMAYYAWQEPLYLMVSTTGTNPSDFTLVQEWSGLTNNSFAQQTVDLSAYAGQQVYIAFRHANSSDHFAIVIDDITIDLGSSGPEPGEGMYVPAGTYYLVAQATEAFTTHINATAAPAPEQVIYINPTDGMTNVEAPVAARWTLGNYTTEMQVLVGSQFPPQDVLIDWTSTLVESAMLNNLLPNTTYFMQVNERNNSGVTMGEVIGFTTAFEKPVVAVATPYLYPGDAAFLSWEIDRSFRGYNVYVDGARWNEELIVEDEYAVEGLAYGSHTINVTAVYDEGESAYSNNILVNMTGFGHVAGTVFEQDGTTPVAGAAVKFIGTDAFGFDQTFTFPTANNGTFTGDILEGSYASQAELEGYQVTPGNHVNIAYEETVSGLVYNMFEEYKPVGQVNSEITADNKANVWWSWAPATVIEDFEHDGEMPEGWNQVGSYGWEVTTNAPYEGTYCIKSSNAGVQSSTGAIEVTVDVPYEAKMSFYVKPSSESNYDKFYFYIDGAEKFNTSGAGSWTKKEFNVSAGTHTYKWAYTKDSSVNSNDDCIYVDYVTLFEKVQPEPPFAGGWIQYDDGTYASSVGTGSTGSNVYWAVCWPNASAYNGLSMTKAALYDAYAGAYTVNIYEGGESAPQTLIGTTTINGTGSSAMVEGTFSTPISIDGSKSLWIVGVCNQLEYPMAGCSYVGDPNSDLLSLDGVTWEHAADYSLSYSWMLRGYLQTAKGDMVVLDAAERAPQNIVRPELTFDYGTPSTGTFMAKVAETPVYVGVASNYTRGEVNNTRSFQSFNVYLKNVLTDEYSKITSTADTTYVHAQWSTLPAGVYQYGVSATYAGNRGQVKMSGISHPAVPVTDPSIDITGRRPGQSPAYNGTMSNVFRGSTAYVDNTYGYAIPSGLCVMDIDNPLGATLLNANTSLYAGEIVDGVIYGYDSNGNFVTIDPATGAILSTISTGATIREMAYDYTTNTMYGSSTAENTLYTIDLTTGAYTAVGTMSNVSAVAGLVCDLNGQLYVMAFTTGDLYMVDKTNASMTLIGNTGRTPAYVQSAAIDYETGTCYWAYSDASNDDLYIVDLATAQASFVCNFVESCGLCFPHASGPIPPTPTGDGESEIVWADPMDKDMVATVDVSAVTNNGQSAAGTLVKFENMVENLVYEETLDETGFVSFADFRKGYYTMSVELAGYAASMGGEVEIFEDKTYNVTLTEVIAPAEGLFASATGWVMWDNIGGDIPTPPQGDTEFTEGFEGGLNGWNVLNVNAAGGTWLHSDDNLQGQIYTSVAHTGTGFALCYSFVDYTGSFDTDSYLYTPQKYQIVNGSTLSFWADNANDSYPENFSVCVATADNPQDADFTEIWSGGAKGGNAEKAAVRHSGNRYNNWRHHTIDLSAYAGQQVYIAFHDVNYDMYEIWIDDVELTAGSKDRAAQYSIVMLDGVIAGQATGNWFQLDTDNLVEGQEYEVSVASVYASGMSEWRTTTFTYYSCENFKPGVKNLAGEVQGVNDVKLTWTLPGGGGSGDEFSFSFDNDLEGWTNIDGDGDGHVFYHSNEAANHSTLAVTSHSGAGHVMGESYCNATWAALTPNDFFVTPQQYNIGASSMLSFWACAQDVNYAAEHFGVAISTTGNTSASDFTTIAEWTLTAKNGGPKGPRATDGSREGAWYEYTCDLSEYAGQAAWIAIRHFNCSDQFIMCLDDIAMSNADGKQGNNRNMWDLLGTFNAAEGGHYGVVTDGEYIYTSNWGYSSALNNFYKYDMEGNVIEGFNISGCGTLRGMTFDGQYVYGVANSSTIYCVDLNNHTLVGTTTSAYGAMRGITYDPARDGFWVIGNWSGNLTLIDRTGAIVQAGPAPTSASDLAYFADPDGVEHVFCFNNGTNDVDDYNIATNTITTAVFNFNSIPGYDGGTSGGCHVATYAGKTAFFGDLQQSPNLIGIYELAEGETPIEGDFLGAMIFRDGELITPEPLMANQMVDVNVPEGEHEYMARLAFGNPEFGTLDTMWYAMSCPIFATVNVEIECTPVSELEAEYEYNADGTYGVNLEWICTGADIQGYKVYRDNSYIGMTTTMSYYDDRTNNPGEYTYGVVAVYDYCESDMVTVEVTVTDVEENSVIEGIYPNPTKGILNINATAMQQITVVNALGQVVMNAEVSGDQTTIDMSGFEAGVYMVTVRTENGSSVKRISVIK